MHLTLFVPELLWPEPADPAAWEGLSLPGLAGLLARGRLSRAAPAAHEDALAAVWGRPGGAPLAALRLLGEDGAPPPEDACWLCADPVHLRFHHERIVLADAGAFELSASEAESFLVALNRDFADLGVFCAGSPRRWYLRLHAPVAHAAPSLSAVAGRRLDRGAGGESPLKAVHNEIQMALHGHPGNASRAAAGTPAVNSLWLWGAGSLATAPPAPPYAWSVAGDPLARGLARAAGATELPATSWAALAAQAPAGAGLAVLDAALPPVLYEDAAAWREALSRLDAAWFVPAARALGRGLASLTLVAPSVYGVLSWRLTAADRWRFWRRPTDLAALARSLAA